ncbi:uncharacterized protein [Euwallacea similis]|uniref:uncharacterized protein isoform X2 n=1 Tax=Euwallacea similis TaxID=1736056 RepID=UPI00344E5CEB
MADGKVAINRPSSANTPPNCAICLGGCTNKCFSNSCMHQFCFQCLLEWSKIKAECPLCKQSFKSIIHNVKSNEEYDEHIVEAPRNEEVGIVGSEDMWFWPVPLPHHRHEFHVRTTFTVDSRGEHAIQQMLLAHPFTNEGRVTINTGHPSARTDARIGSFPVRYRRDFSATGFRRSIYAQNMWANAAPDITGRYRDCSPVYFRNNPAARQRLVPWLNRELNALLYENTQLIMHLVDLIMDQLLRHHICSRTFRIMLREYLDVKTDHFVHEFYNFMRSPLDMVGYDRNVLYANRPESPAPVLGDDTVEIHDNSDDSDVVLVGETNPAEPVTIDLVDSNSDSDELIMISSTNNQVPMPLPAPVPMWNANQEPLSLTRPVVPMVNLPPKLRHKHLKTENCERPRWNKKKQHRRSRSSSSSWSSSGELTKREKESYKRYKRKKLLKKLRPKHQHINSSNSSSEVDVTTESETEDEKPLIDILKDMKQKKRRLRKERKKRASRRDSFTITTEPKIEIPSQMFPIDLSTPSCSRLPSSSSSSSRYHIELPKTRSTVELSNDGQYTSVQIETSAGLADTSEPSTSKTKIKIVRNGRNSPQHSREREQDESGNNTEPYKLPAVKSEIRRMKYMENPGPSTSRATPLVLRREHNKWYIFDESDSSDY